MKPQKASNLRPSLEFGMFHLRVDFIVVFAVSDAHAPIRFRAQPKTATSPAANRT